MAETDTSLGTTTGSDGNARVSRLSAGEIRVWILSAGLGAGACLLLTVFAAGLDAPLRHPHVPWVGLVVGFGLAEVFVIHVRFKQDAHTFSLSEIPLVVALIFVGPFALVTSQALGVGVALVAHRRQSPLKLGFNLGQRVFTSVAAVFVFQFVTLLGGVGWPAVWGAAFLAALIADMLSGLLINLAIALSENERICFDEILGPGNAFTLAGTAIGLVAAMVLAQHPAGIVLVLIPAATTYLAGNAYSALQRKHENLTLLYESTRLAQRSLQLGILIPTLLKQAREMFQAEVAEVILLPENGQGAAFRSALEPTRSEVLEPVQLNPLEGVWARVASERQGIVLPRPILNDRLAAYFAGRGIRDAMVVPLSADQGMLGTMLVANRIGDFSTFNSDDLKLLETLGNHVAVALRNARLVLRLERSLAHETEMNKMKDDFVATISHELRTPLTSVQGYIKTLLRQDITLSSDEQREFLDRADQQSERLRRLIEDLLFTSRIEASGLPLTTQAVHIPGIADRVLDGHAGTSNRDRFVFDLQPDLPLIWTSEEQLFRILGNLMDNAVKYSPPEGEIVLSARWHDGGVLLSVKDRGEGIPPGERDRIFERFYQVDQSSTRRVGGAGMGLYICRRAAELLGGRLWLDSSDSTGTTFSLWLPPGRPEAIIDLAAAS
jgi:signal transduction histidine kinase